MPATLRLFVALYPPAAVAEAMLARAARLDLPKHRTTPAGQVHMTLQFMGDTRAAKLGETIESVERAAAGIGAFTLSPERLLTLPKHGPARLVAAETDAPAPLLEMQRRLAQRLSRVARKNAGDRFLPHVTLLRFAGAGVGGLDVDVKLETAPFQVDRIVLMRSTLTSLGAEHREVGAAAL